MLVQVFWVTLLVHPGDSKAPVMTVEFGEPATITCALSEDDFKNRQIHWYKQSPGDTLKVIIAVVKKKTSEYRPESSNRLEVKTDDSATNLTITRTTKEDEGMYHCAVKEWIETKWRGTYLLVRENTEKTLNYSVVQSSTGDSVSLQCSVLSDSTKTCPESPIFYWVRTGSDKSGPGIIYTDVNDECELRSDSAKSCVYSFSKNVSSSDAGTYHCAVASCGHILYGDGTELIIEQNVTAEFLPLVILTVCLVISVTGNIVLICYRTARPACDRCGEKEVSSLKTRYVDSSKTECDITEVNYAAIRFSGGKSGGSKKKEVKTEDSVYAQVKS